MLTPLSAKLLASKSFFSLFFSSETETGLDDFEDLEKVSEMVAETSESSKQHQSESTTIENNTCTCTSTCFTSVNNTCTCTCRICNSWLVQKKRLFSVKNVLLCYKSNGQCLACEHLLRYLRALPTICVHTELDGRTLDIVHSLIGLCFSMHYRVMEHAGSLAVRARKRQL